MKFTFNGQPVTLIGQPGDHIYDSIVNGKTFYEDKMLEYIRTCFQISDGIVVDVGANIGNHTVFFGLFTLAPHIVAIEPQRVVVPFLRQNVLDNHLGPRVTIYDCAVGANVGTVGLSPTDPKNMGSTHVTGCGQDAIMTTLDLLINEPVSLMKIDVEGYEIEVLKGADRILRTYHPLLFLEAATSPEKQALDDFLQPYGYTSRRVFNWTPTYLYQ